MHFGQRQTSLINQWSFTLKGRDRECYLYWNHKEQAFRSSGCWHREHLWEDCLSKTGRQRPDGVTQPIRQSPREKGQNCHWARLEDSDFKRPFSSCREWCWLKKIIYQESQVVDLDYPIWDSETWSVVRGRTDEPNGKRDFRDGEGDRIAWKASFREGMRAWRLARQSQNQGRCNLKAKQLSKGCL